MKQLHKNTTELSDLVKSVFAQMNYGSLKGITTKNQKEQRKIVRSLQEAIVTALDDTISGEWEMEHAPLIEAKDAIDIYGKTTSGHVVIEMDKPRADQVAKKMLSRFSFFDNGSVLYVAFCYPGTTSMNPEECKKYFGYGRKIIQQLHPESQLIGILIRKRTFKPEFYDGN